MTITAEAIRLLADKGLSAHEIAEIAEALTPAKSAAAERQARYRQRKKAKASRNDGDVTRYVTPLPNDIYSNPTPVIPSLANANDAPLPVDRLVSAWNAASGDDGLKPSRTLNADRKAKANRRLAEFGEEALLEGIRKLAASPFHCGEGSRGWKADFGWYVRSAENVTKALELDAPQPVASQSPLVKSILANQTKREAVNA
jgi:hypothetical protein